GAPLEDPDPTFPTVEAAHKALSFVTVEVCGCHVTGKAKDIAGRVLDSFTLSSCKVPCGAPLAAKGGAPCGSAISCASPGSAASQSSPPSSSHPRPPRRGRRCSS